MSVSPEVRIADDEGAAGASVRPRAHAQRWLLEAGGAALEVDPAAGGRITALRLGARNLLTGPEIDAGNYGSTFWTSPQSDWGWPPVAEIDHAPFEASVVGGRELVLRGPVSARLGVSIEKRFSGDAARGSFRIEYVVTNVSAAPVRAAPWEITRVPPGGLTFFPTGSGLYPPSNLALSERDGITWFAYDARDIVDHQKAFADGREGWIAHVDRDAILVKAFAAVPRAEHAPGEAQIEIYA